MDENKTAPAKERQTLMQAFERLDHQCVQLSDLVDLTERLNEKLNRIEDHPKEPAGEFKKQTEDHRSIVELFNLIADRMEVQINIIGNNTERSMQMID